MADMNTGKGKGSPRVDLTAMVDLGFLLITFFMFTTTLNKPKTMEINKPAEEKEKDLEPPVKKSRTLSVLLGENDKVYYYVGADDATTVELDSTDFSDTGIRKVILRRQKEVAELYAAETEESKKQLVVLIKSMPTAPYRSLVSIMDEMNITNTKIYAIVDTDKVDTLIMQTIGQGFLPAAGAAPVLTPQ